jgi:unsaturated chondroitin disaccharide hydrolase
MLIPDPDLRPADLLPAIARMWEASAAKMLAIEEAFPVGSGTPVITREGRYVAQGWTEWTQGFQFGSALIQFEATGDERFLEIGRENTRSRMAAHVSHVGVHDHGFNNVSTYGRLRELMLAGRIPHDRAEFDFYELALKVSGAVQAARWSPIRGTDFQPVRTSEDARIGNPCHAEHGFVHSFNGPHSLFSDTIRSMRSLCLAHALGHRLMGENDETISLLGRAIEHARATAEFNVYFGRERDEYDVRGRVVHESIFNPTDGRYRCPSTQQGYSPFSTWTRGLAWVMLGFPEMLAFVATVDDGELEPHGGREEVEDWMLEAARAACDFFVENTPMDGVPYWDTGAPGLVHLGDYLDRPSDPFNDHEPIDSSAAAIGAQGLLRLADVLRSRGDGEDARRYEQAGLSVLRTLLDEPYTSTDPAHQGLLLHTIYHRPRGWDFVPAGSRIPRGEAAMWGDYHLREVALLVQQMADG